MRNMRGRVPQERREDPRVCVRRCLRLTPGQSADYLCWGLISDFTRNGVDTVPRLQVTHQSRLAKSRHSIRIPVLLCANRTWRSPPTAHTLLNLQLVRRLPDCGLPAKGLVLSWIHLGPEARLSSERRIREWKSTR